MLEAMSLISPRISREFYPLAYAHLWKILGGCGQASGVDEVEFLGERPVTRAKSDCRMMIGTDVRMYGPVEVVDLEFAVWRDLKAIRGSFFLF